MAIRDMLRPNGKRLTLHRKAWTESSNPLVAEARSQTLAIQQLQLWLRLAYSALALAVLLGYWGFTDGQNLVLGIVGCVISAFALVVVIVLRTGIRNGRRNVEAMLEAMQGNQVHIAE